MPTMDELKAIIRELVEAAQPFLDAGGWDEETEALFKACDKAEKVLGVPDNAV